MTNDAALLHYSIQYQVLNNSFVIHTYSNVPKTIYEWISSELLQSCGTEMIIGLDL